MASFFIGDGATNGGSDLDSGSRFVLSPQAVFELSWSRHIGSPLEDPEGGVAVQERPMIVDASWDQGEFGFPFPANARVYPTVVVTGVPGAPHALPASFNIGTAASEGFLPTSISVFGLSGVGGTEGFLLQTFITDRVIETPIELLGGTGLNIFLTETAVFAVQVTGDFPVFTIEPLLREFFADADPDGIRPSTPWCITRTVTHHAEVVVDGVFQLVINEPFLVDAAHTAATDPILAALGARANYVGMVVQEVRPDASLATLARFRAPEEDEVIVIKPCDVRRWNGTIWAVYQTQPERNLAGQLVFDLLDPDGVYDYYAKVVGSFMAQWQYDNERLRDFTEPRVVPDAYVALLGDNFGLIGDTEDPVHSRRSFIRQFVQLQRDKGSPQSIVDALTILGFTGYAKHIWAIPGGASTAYIERPLGYDVITPAGPYHPASQVSIHLNDADGFPIIIDEGIRQRVGDFLMRFVLPAHVRVRTFATDVPVKSSSEGAGVADSLTITDL